MGGINVEFNEYRPCEVKGIKALFHRYVEDEKILIKSNIMTKRSLEKEIALKHLEMILEGSVIPYGYDIEKISKTVALVEYEDGTVHKVDPTDVKFLDSKEKFEEVCDAEEN